MFLKNEKCGKDFVAGFAKNDHESLCRRILTNTSQANCFKGVWRITSKINTNPGKKTVRIAEPVMSTTHTL